MNRPLRHRERRPVPLNLIIGRSPRNCRPASADENVEDLAASIDAIGLLMPLFVSAVPGPLLRFEVDAGGRRLAALRLLHDRGLLPADHKVECDVLVADEAVVREISLAENTMRRDLHPVDQCDAFEAMVAAGHSEEKIAADFAITVRQVRQRLKLNRLSPRVRAAWRDGTLTTEAAQAMTLGSHNEQDALLDEHRDLGGAGNIRHHFLNARKAVRAATPEALYVGLDAYVAAGGGLDENLFEDHALILDVALLNRLAREKMIREGEALLETTGFGFCMIFADVERQWEWPSIEPDYLDEERARLDEITDSYDAIVQDTEDGDAEIAALNAEEEAIEIRALDRACTPERKAAAGIFLGLDRDGTLVTDRGRQRPVMREAPGAPAFASTTKGSAAPTKPDPIEAAAGGRGLIRSILEKTILDALAAIVAHRPDLALMMVVARYGGTWRADWILESFGLSPNGKPDHVLLRQVDGKDFDKAIAICADAPLADLTSAFSTIVSRSFKPSPHATLGSLDPMMRALARRGAALRPAFVKAMDYDAYFASATKAACLSVLEALSTPLVDAQAKKPVLAALAIEAARKAEWLPFPLAGWATVEAASPEAPQASEPDAEPQSLAGAMDQAIDSDEARKSALRTFLETACELRAGAKIKASTLYAFYRERVTDPVPLAALGAEIASLGVPKKRMADGVFYLGIALAGEA